MGGANGFPEKAMSRLGKTPRDFKGLFDNPGKIFSIKSRVYPRKPARCGPHLHHPSKVSAKIAAIFPRSPSLSHSAASGPLNRTFNLAITAPFTRGGRS